MRDIFGLNLELKQFTKRVAFCDLFKSMHDMLHTVVTPQYTVVNTGKLVLDLPYMLDQELVFYSLVLPPGSLLFYRTVPIKWTI